jgi:fluoroquinolone transport system ATP-binding protein
VAVIDVRSFGFTYPGAQWPAVRDLAFSVEPGEIFGFLGPSGAGKSTTQNVLIRLLDGYEGNVAVLGQDLRAWDRGYYRRIGVSFEAPNHYLKLTARENLQLFAGCTAAAQKILTLYWSASDWNRTATSSSQSSRKVCAAV